MANQTHVTPNNEKGGWDVKQDDAKRASAHRDTKKEAVERGREISENQETELVIHSKNGQIDKKDSHGKDPHPPKG